MKAMINVNRTVTIQREIELPIYFIDYRANHICKAFDKHRICVRVKSKITDYLAIHSHNSVMDNFRDEEELDTALAHQDEIKAQFELALQHLISAVTGDYNKEST